MSQNPITNDQLADQFATVHALTTPQRLNLLIEYLDVLAFVPSLTFAAFLERKTELLDTPSNTDVLNFYMPTKLGEHTFTATQRVDALRLYATYRGLIGPDDPIVDLAAFLREGLIADGIPVPEPKAAKPKRAPKKPKEEAPSATVAPEPEPAPPSVVHGEPRGIVVFQTAVLPQIRELLQRDTRTSNDLGAVLVHSCVDIAGVGTVHISVVNADPQPYLDVFLANTAGETLAELPPLEKHNTSDKDGNFVLPTLLTIPHTTPVTVAVRWDG